MEECIVDVVHVWPLRYVRVYLRTADVRYDDRIQGYSPSVRKLCKNLLLGQLSILTHVRLMDTGFELIVC